MAIYWDVLDDQGKLLGRAATDSADDAVDLAQHTEWGQAAHTAEPWFKA